MSALATAVLAHVQRSPGRWTIDQLCAATGEFPAAVGAALHDLIKLGQIEQIGEASILETPQSCWRSITYTPTVKGWIRP